MQKVYNIPKFAAMQVLIGRQKIICKKILQNNMLNI